MEVFDEMAEANSSLDQELIQLNEEIGRKEQAGEVQFFDTRLTDNFLFRRAKGKLPGEAVSKRRGEAKPG
jgi:hypothetical protein